MTEDIRPLSTEEIAEFRALANDAFNFGRYSAVEAAAIAIRVLSLLDEVERLRADNEKLLEWHRTLFSDKDAELTHLRARVAELEGALKRISGLNPRNGDTLSNAISIAALTQKEPARE